jgi:hypothetical protein
VFNESVFQFLPALFAMWSFFVEHRKCQKFLAINLVECIKVDEFLAQEKLQ